MNSILKTRVGADDPHSIALDWPSDAAAYLEQARYICKCIYLTVNQPLERTLAYHEL